MEATEEILIKKLATKEIRDAIKEVNIDLNKKGYHASLSGTIEVESSKQKEDSETYDENAEFKEPTSWISY